MKIIISEKQLKFILEQQDRDFTMSTGKLDVGGEERYPFEGCNRFIQILDNMFLNFKKKNPTQKDKNFTQSTIMGQLNRIKNLKDEDFLSTPADKTYIEELNIKNFQDYINSCVKDTSKMSSDNKNLILGLRKGKTIPHPKGEIGTCKGGMGQIETPSCRQMMRGRGFGGK